MSLDAFRAGVLGASDLLQVQYSEQTPRVIDWRWPPALELDVECSPATAVQCRPGHLVCAWRDVNHRVPHPLVGVLFLSRGLLLSALSSL